MLKDVIIDTLVDSAKLIPFLFVAFLLIEYIEHKMSKKMEKSLKKSGKFGPVIGGLLGAIPQCGFSVLASNLYVTRLITLGTLVAVYLSTSDEMLPILLSSGVAISKVLIIVLTKVAIGIICGIIIDLFVRKKEKLDYHICNDEHCDCEESILKSTIIHTLKTLLFIAIITFALNLLFAVVSEGRIAIFASFISSLIGLIPNCGASIMITVLYIKNVISFGTCIGGLLTGSGLALLVLFKTNKNIKENIKILLIVYFIGAIVGTIINILGITL